MTEEFYNGEQLDADNSKKIADGIKKAKERRERFDQAREKVSIDREAARAKAEQSRVTGIANATNICQKDQIKAMEEFSAGGIDRGTKDSRIKDAELRRAKKVEEVQETYRKAVRLIDIEFERTYYGMKESDFE
jgi:hypothetical protein